MRCLHDVRQKEVHVDRDAVTKLVEKEIAAIRDPKTLSLTTRLRVQPYPVARSWDYGAQGQKYVCWTVLEHQPSKTGIAYCEAGFGPRNSWGLVWLDASASIGMDDAWYVSLEDALRESMAWDDENPPG